MADVHSSSKERLLRTILKYFYSLPRLGDPECRIVDAIEKLLEKS